jgi:chromosome segregation ATPase
MEDLMKMWLTTRIVAVIVAGCVLLPAAGQSASADASTIQALLSEIRQLRLALERSALLGPKLQLTLQRMQIQQQNVARISTQLEALRKEISAEASVPARAAEDLVAIEQKISEETDPSRKKAWEDQRTILKRLASRVDVDPQLRARENDLAAALRTEQAAMAELNEKLNALERQLDAPAPREP